MSDNIITKSILYGIFMFTADWYIYEEYNYKLNILDSLLFSVDYIIANYLLDKINIKKNYWIKSFYHFVIYLLTYNIVFKKYIDEAISNSYYKTWYVILIWVFALQFTIEGNTNKIKNSYETISEFIQNNYDSIITINRSDNLNNNKVQNVEVYEIIDYINQIDIFTIKNDIEEFLDVQYIQTSIISEEYLIETYDIYKHNVLTYYHRVLCPFTYQSLDLLKNVIYSLFDILTIYKEDVPFVDELNDARIMLNNFQSGLDFSEKDISYKDTILNILYFIHNNVKYHIPEYHNALAVANVYETGRLFGNWIEGINKFTELTNEFIEKTKKREKFVVIEYHATFVLPRVKKFLPKLEELEDKN
jgi:hypothetical protein